MKRRVVFLLALTLLPAALLPEAAGARQRPPNVESPPQSPPEVWRFPRPPHEDASLRSRGNARPVVTPSKKDRQLLAVPGELKQAHADFLKRSRTGIVRLLPRGVYDRQVSLRGGGAYYSFDARTHAYGYGSDIELQRGSLSVGFAGADFGFLVDLGDTPLESVSAETDALRFMLDFEVPSDESEARAAALQFSRVAGRVVDGRRVEVRGQQVDGRSYSRTLPAIVGHTYALRSVNYRYSDVLVAFRVVRRDEDGSVILLWRVLKKFPTPTLSTDSARR